MREFVSHFLSSAPFIPHGHCYLWKPGLVLLHLSSDTLIALAYYSIPVTLFYFVQRRKDLPFNWIFLLFAAFIVACGTTHLLEVWTLWYPTYWVSGAVKVMTAAVSLFTAGQLVPLVPKALALPSPAQLEMTNQELQSQINERLKAEAELRQYRDHLEELVQARTLELSQINEQLQQEVLERQRTEDALRQSEELFRQLAENIHEVSWLIAPQDQQMLYISPTYEQIWGRSCDSLYDDPGSWLTAVHPDDQKSVTLAFEQRQTQEDNFSQEFRILRPDDSMRWVQLREFPIRNEAGEVYRIASLAEDITDRKQADAELEQALEREKMARTEAEAANRAKDEFLSILSHELRTPLNSVLGWAQLLRTRTNLDPTTINRALETIERNAKNQASLIEDLLDISRIITGKLYLNVQPLQLIPVIQAAIDTVRPAAEAKQIQLETWFAPNVPQIVGDGDRLQQVVWNLISNAIKFTPKGGQVQVQMHHTDSQVAIVVSDTGQGIAPAFLPFVFDRFQQANSSTTRAHGGLGLGLAIVRHLVELHGGSVTATSAGENQGATFVVTLPVVAVVSIEDKAPRPTMAESPPSLTTPLRLDGLQILVVDDEADARELLSTALLQCGAAVATAASAYEALAWMEKNSLDVLISDIGMPEEDGYSFMRKVRGRKSHAWEQIRAIALTAYTRPDELDRALSAGFQQYTPKPVNLMDLTRLIVNLVKQNPSDQVQA